MFREDMFPQGSMRCSLCFQQTWDWCRAPVLTGRRSDFRLSTNLETTPQFGATHRPARFVEPTPTTASRGRDSTRCDTLRPGGPRRRWASRGIRSTRRGGGRFRSPVSPLGGDVPPSRGLHDCCRGCLPVTPEAASVPGSAWQDAARHPRESWSGWFRRRLFEWPGGVSASALEPLCGLAQTVHQRRLRAPGQPAPGLRYVERNTVHLARAGGGVEGIAPEAGEGSEMAGNVVHRGLHAGADVGQVGRRCVRRQEIGASDVLNVHASMARVKMATTPASPCGSCLGPYTLA